jgi:hypothetical protein
MLVPLSWKLEVDHAGELEERREKLRKRKKV